MCCLMQLSRIEEKKPAWMSLMRMLMSRSIAGLLGVLGLMRRDTPAVLLPALGRPCGCPAVPTARLRSLGQYEQLSYEHIMLTQNLDLVTECIP